MVSFLGRNRAKLEGETNRANSRSMYMTGTDQDVRFTAVDDIASFAEYEDGRVKPATVLKSTGANVVVFAFDAGTELREHHATGPVLLQVLEGAVTVTV